jgi:hypothetical protein
VCPALERVNEARARGVADRLRDVLHRGVPFEKLLGFGEPNSALIVRREVPSRTRGRRGLRGDICRSKAIMPIDGIIPVARLRRSRTSPAVPRRARRSASSRVHCSSQRRSAVVSTTVRGRSRSVLANPSRSAGRSNAGIVPNTSTYGLGSPEAGRASPMRGGAMRSPISSKATQGRTQRSVSVRERPEVQEVLRLRL